MKPVDQIDFSTYSGDCFRACVASIFEFPVLTMPNFWEDTGDAGKYWRLTNEWLSNQIGYKCITVEVGAGHQYVTEDVMCVAIGKSPRGEQEHAVVWMNGVIHDPHPLRIGLTGVPSTFTFFVPLNPKGGPHDKG